MCLCNQATVVSGKKQFQLLQVFQKAAAREQVCFDAWTLDVGCCVMSRVVLSICSQYLFMAATAVNQYAVHLQKPGPS